MVWVVQVLHWSVDTSLWVAQPLLADAFQLAVELWLDIWFKMKVRKPPPGTMQCHLIASFVGLQTGFHVAARKEEVRRAQ